jgi:putative ABC transport system permease protein
MSALMQLAYVVLTVLLVILLLAARRRVLARMALRNISRRKKYSAIIVVGLLIATAMISASLVVGDTLDYVIKSDVFDSTGDTDIVLTIEDDTGIYQFFDETVAYDIIERLDDGSLPHIDEVAPAIREVCSAIHPETAASASSAYIFAYDPENMINELVDVDGGAISPDLIVGGNAVINEELADSLEVDIGDSITVYPKNGLPAALQISAVAANEGMGNWRFSDMVFVHLSYAQSVIFQKPSMITTIDISCAGSMEEGYLVTDEAVAELREALPGAEDYTFTELKKDGVEQAEGVADAISQLFVLMSSFTIIAGVALIVNLFVMLAEERKSEMGISRAIGMQRRDLTQTFVFEGLVYALAAAAVGTFFGLLIAFIMISAFATIIGGGGMAFVLHFEWTSLALAMLAGFLITMLTVIAASWRVSKLNIVRAIRDIPEPVQTRTGRKYLLYGVMAIALGILLLYGGGSSRQAVGTSSGMALVALGAALTAVRFVRPRVPFTAAGFWMIFYSLDPLKIEPALFGELEGNLEMFIVGGVVMVTGGVLMAMFNSDLILDGLVRVFGRNRTLLPVFRAAVSYPMNKKFRTGLSVFIFALIMFTVVVIAMNASFQRESVDNLTEKFSGGFEVVGYSLREIPSENLTEAVESVNDALGADVIDRMESVRTALVTLEVVGINDPVRRNLVGFSEEMLGEGGFSLAQRSGQYESDEDAWNALKEDHNLTILDGTVVAADVGVSFGTWYAGIGDVVTTTFADGTTVNLTVIGIMDQMIVAGAFTSEAFVEATAAVSSRNLFYVDTARVTGLTDEEVKDALEKGLAEYGFSGIVIKDIIEEVMKISSSMMQLMEVFLGVGLVVGIAGLGIITIRNIAERRQEIGVMRAIGFQKNMVLGTFLIETSFVSLLGIVMGVVLGLLISHSLFYWAGFSEFSRFVIPWGEVLLVLLIAFAITILSTLPPSRAAARLAPAEALRRID